MRKLGLVFSTAKEVIIGADRRLHYYHYLTCICKSVWRWTVFAIGKLNPLSS